MISSLGPLFFLLFEDLVEYMAPTLLEILQSLYYGWQNTNEKLLNLANIHPLSYLVLFVHGFPLCYICQVWPQDLCHHVKSLGQRL
jgi:hypothetical protein